VRVVRFVGLMLVHVDSLLRYVNGSGWGSFPGEHEEHVDNVVRARGRGRSNSVIGSKTGPTAIRRHRSATFYVCYEFERSYANLAIIK
jgi:hypothetical protein